MRPASRLFLALAAFSSSALAEANTLSEEEAAPPPPPSLTLRATSIDSHGADPSTPWTVHLDGLEVRRAPCLETGHVLGTLSLDTEIRGRYVVVEETDEEWLEVDFLGQTAYVFRIGFSRIHPANQVLIDDHGNLPFGQELINRWWGIPLDYEPDDLVELPSEYGRRGEEVSYRLRREAAASLIAMMDEMRAAGIDIFVSSAYRSGQTQRTLFTRSTGRRPNQRSSAPPGHSEHQLGTTVDLARDAVERSSLRNTDPQHAWLAAHGARFGWRQTYLADNVAETGYIEEPWHWRYLGAPTRP